MRNNFGMSLPEKTLAAGIHQEIMQREAPDEHRRELLQIGWSKSVKCRGPAQNELETLRVCAYTLQRLLQGGYLAQIQTVSHGCIDRGMGMVVFQERDRVALDLA